VPAGKALALRIMMPSTIERFEEMAIASLLQHRYSDGMIHVQTQDDRILLKKAIGLGFVDQAGYVTRAGDDFCLAWQALDERESA